jgi:hypothetical protein
LDAARRPARWRSRRGQLFEPEPLPRRPDDHRTDTELNRIGGADELSIAPLGTDGSPGRRTTIWVVRVGDELYVRSWHGRAGAGSAGGPRSHQGHIRAGGVDRDVDLTEPEGGVRPAIDQAYRDKYGRYGDSYVGAMVGDVAAAASFRLTPN